MINYKEIEQNTPEWHKIKWGKIGGTLSKGLFIDSDTLFIDILSQYIEDYDDDEDEGFQSLSMIRGKELEPRAIEYAERYTCIKFNSTGWLQSEENRLLGISPDGISDCEEYGVEAKCLSRKEHTAILVENKTPKEKVSQIVHYFTVNPKFKKVFFIAFRPESIRPFIEEFTRESVVDMGWKKKIEVEVIGAKGMPIKPKIESVIDWRTINEWTKISIKKADGLDLKVKETISKLSF